VDADDFHKTLFDKDRLTRLMVAAGLVLIEPWSSELKDCAALPISLNLCGMKPRETDMTNQITELRHVESCALGKHGAGGVALKINFSIGGGAANQSEQFSLPGHLARQLAQGILKMLDETARTD